MTITNQVDQVNLMAKKKQSRLEIINENPQRKESRCQMVHGPLWYQVFVQERKSVFDTVP